MSKICNKIPLEVKSQILSELQAPGCIVSSLAKSYNISNTTIYSWQRQARGIKVATGNEGEKPNNFVELSVTEPKNFIMEKASLIFNGFSLVIEGKVNSSSLFEIVKILERQ